MMNLASKEIQKVVQREYWTRVVSVWALLLAAALSVIALLLVPSYVLLTLQRAALIPEGEDGLSQNVTASEEVIVKANAHADQLASGTVETRMSDILFAIDAVAIDGITIQQYEMGRTVRTIEQVSIGGVARSREVLAAFSVALEASPYFESASVPIANLARDTNLPFSITVTVSDGAKQ